MRQKSISTLQDYNLFHVIDRGNFKMEAFTFSETLLLLPFRSSGAIHGRVPLTPPETKVFRLIFDRPKSPTWNIHS